MPAQLAILCAAHRAEIRYLAPLRQRAVVAAVQTILKLTVDRAALAAAVPAQMLPPTAARVIHRQYRPRRATLLQLTTRLFITQAQVALVIQAPVRLEALQSAALAALAPRHLFLARLLLTQAAAVVASKEVPRAAQAVLVVAEMEQEVALALRVQRILVEAVAVAGFRRKAMAAQAAPVL